VTLDAWQIDVRRVEAVGLLTSGRFSIRWAIAPTTCEVTGAVSALFG